jgi:hypothetical protein
MLYEMFTGIQPFRDEHYMGVIQNIINKNAPHPSKFSVEIPSSAQSLLSKAMNKSREARFQHAGDFKKAIEKYLGLRQLKDATESLKHLLTTDGDTLVLSRTANGRKNQSRLRRGFVVALAAAALFGAAGIGYSLGPEAIQAKMDNIVSWLDHNNPFASAGENQMSGIGGGMGDSYLSTLVPDTVYVPVRVDSQRTAPDTIIVEKPVPIPVVASADTTPAPTQTTLESNPVATTQQEQPSTEKGEDPEPADKPVKVRKGWLSISADPWAEVYIDGAYRGDTPPALKVELTRGPHRVECRNPGHVSYGETVRITAGELSTRRVMLKKLKGHLSITTTAGAEVFVDGNLVGVTPLGRALELDAGTHQVTVKKAGFNVWNNQIAVIANETLPLNIKLSPIY